MKRIHVYVLNLVFALGASGTTRGEVVSLASQMAGSSIISEDSVTGAFARIDLSPDGLWNLANPAQQFGTINLFSNQGSFGIGDFSFDRNALTGSGVETTQLTGISFADFWAPGSSSTDINDSDTDGLGAWFFGLSRSFTFGGLDAADTVTFTDGLLTSIDTNTTMQFNMVDGGGNNVTWNGVFTLVGNDVTFAINDTQSFDTGFFGSVNSNFVTSLTGTVDAVGSYQITAVPEPTSFALLGFASGVFAWRGRRRFKR